MRCGHSVAPSKGRRHLIKTIQPPLERWKAIVLTDLRAGATLHIEARARVGFRCRRRFSERRCRTGARARVLARIAPAVGDQQNIEARKRMEGYFQANQAPQWYAFRSRLIENDGL